VENFHAGHIISEKEGGQTNETNLLPVCSQCNISMGIMDMGSFVKNNFPNNYSDFCNRKYKTKNIFNLF